MTWKERFMWAFKIVWVCLGIIGLATVIDDAGVLWSNVVKAARWILTIF